ILQSRHWPVSLSASAIFHLFGAGATQDGLRKVRFALDSALEGSGFELVWGFSCQVVALGFAESSLFGAGRAVLRPVACDQVPGARGRGRGTETLAQLGGLPPYRGLCFAAP